MIYYHYGNLKDGTITESGSSGSPTIDAQYPVTNINYLNKNLSTQFTVNGAGIQQQDIIIDMGSAVTASSIALDYSANVSSSAANLVRVSRSSDNSSYTTIKTFKSGSGTHVYDGVDTFTFTEITYRYYKLEIQAESATTADYVIRNLYIGDYIELPSPAFVPYGFTHKVKSSESFGGSRFGIDTQGQRKTWAFKYGGLDNDDKTNIESFDLVNKGGSVPCYIESLEGSTQIIDPHFARVYGGETLQQIAYRVYEMTNNIEEEL